MINNILSYGRKRTIFLRLLECITYKKQINEIVNFSIDLNNNYESSAALPISIQRRVTANYLKILKIKMSQNLFYLTYKAYRIKLTDIKKNKEMQISTNCNVVQNLFSYHCIGNAE